MLLSLTTGEWIVAAGSAVVLLLSIVPLVWLGWRFVQMSDDAVAADGCRRPALRRATRPCASRDEVRLSQRDGLPRPG